MSYDDKEEKRRVMHSVKSTFLKSIPVFIFIVIGLWLLATRSFIFNSMTGPAYFFSPEGYYWTLESSQGAVVGFEALDPGKWTRDNDEDEDGDDLLPKNDDGSSINDDFNEKNDGDYNISYIVDILEDFAIDNCDPEATLDGGEPLCGEIGAVMKYHCKDSDLTHIIFGTVDAEQCNPFNDDVRGCTAGFFFNSTSDTSVICPEGFL